MPNSLIFAVILAVWAVYLTQHWIRRRDHVATARSVDRFSEAMRVLERRQSMPRADLSVPTPRSYSVSLTRPAHPDVVVKRAQHQQSAPAARRRRGVRIGMPSVRVRRALALTLGVLGLAAGVTLTTLGHLQTWGALAGVGALLLSLTYIRFSVGVQRRRAASPVRAGGRPVRARPAASAEEQRRAASTVRSAPATPARVAKKASRKAARKAAKEKAARRSTKKRSGRKAAPETSTRRTAAQQPAHRTEPAARRSADVAEAPRPTTQVAQAPRQTTQVAQAPRPTTQVAQAPRQTTQVAQAPSEVYDVAAAEARTTPVAVSEPAPAAPAAPAAQEAGTWSPVPVPPPTYTLKARAPRPLSGSEPAGSGTAGSGTAAAPSDRGRAPASTPFEDLPFDGHALALDEEFEELPAVHRVG